VVVVLVSGLVMSMIGVRWAAANGATVVPPETLATIADDDPAPLPRGMTAAEKAMPLPVPDLREIFAAPVGAVRTPPEYAFNDGMLVRWGSFNDLLTAMTVGATTGHPGATVWILVETAGQQSSASTTLTIAGADMSRVEFITYDGDSVWMRDYGPRFIVEDGQRAMVDHTYNRPARPKDNAFPAFLSGQWGEPRYAIPLTHGGGNFHLFATGDAHMTELIVNENPTLTAGEIQQLYVDYQNLAVTIETPFPTWYDSTQHIDMWMLPVSDTAVIIGEYSVSDSVPHTVTEQVATDFTNQGITVYRTPGWSSGFTHYTYTNSVILNDVVFVCEFSGYATENAAALATYETAFAGRQVIPVDCSDIIGSAGAVHCIVMHVPSVDVLFIDGFESGGAAGWSSVVAGGGRHEEAVIPSPHRSVRRGGDEGGVLLP
jgi:agmatine/peptidylarginine deiminase